MIMVNNPALANLEKELKQEEENFKQKEAALKEAKTKAEALENDIKSHREEIRKLEQDIKVKTPEIRKYNDLYKKLEGEIRTLNQRREQDHFKLTKITRDAADAIKKAEQEKRIHPDIRHN